MMMANSRPGIDQDVDDDEAVCLETSRSNVAMLTNLEPSRYCTQAGVGVGVGVSEWPLAHGPCHRSKVRGAMVRALKTAWPGLALACWSESMLPLDRQTGSDKRTSQQRPNFNARSPPNERNHRALPPPPIPLVTCCFECCDPKLHRSCPRPIKPTAFKASEYPRA